MCKPNIVTTAECYGCQEHLYTTQAAIDARIEEVEALEHGEERKHPPNTIEAWCINNQCPKPHTGAFIGVNYIPGLELPK